MNRNTIIRPLTGIGLGLAVLFTGLATSCDNKAGPITNGNGPTEPKHTYVTMTKNGDGLVFDINYTAKVDGPRPQSVQDLYDRLTAISTTDGPPSIITAINSLRDLAPGPLTVNIVAGNAVIAWNAETQTFEMGVNSTVPSIAQMGNIFNVASAWFEQNPAQTAEDIVAALAAETMDRKEQAAINAAQRATLGIVH